MKIGIVICPSADLPDSFIKANDVTVMPIHLNFKDHSSVDIRDPKVTQNFYKQYLIDKDLHAETEPLSSDEMAEWFLEKLVTKYDRVIALMLTSKRSTSYANMMEASNIVLQKYRQKRKEAGVDGPFALRVIDTKNLFTGEALVAYETIRLIRGKNLSFEKMFPRIEAITNYTYGHLVPEDLYYWRNVGRKKGDKSLSAIKYMVATGFDLKPIVTCYRGESYSEEKVKGFDAAVAKLLQDATEAVDKGLHIPAVCMSYAGDPSVITKRQVYKDFIAHVGKNSIKHSMAIMSITAGINLGPGSFSIAYAPKES